MNMELKQKVKCLKCGQIIEGDLKGTFIQCKCGKTAIDQTNQYVRIIGNKKDFKVLNSR